MGTKFGSSSVDLSVTEDFNAPKHCIKLLHYIFGENRMTFFEQEKTRLFSKYLLAILPHVPSFSHESLVDDPHHR